MPSPVPDTPCYLNGTFTTLAHAHVSVLDRGFIFGDGIYEVVPVYAGCPFRFDAHMARLARSLAAVRITNPHTPAQWADIATRLIAAFADATGVAADTSNQLVYIQITRGVAPRDHVMPLGVTPTVFVMTNVMKPVPLVQREQGVSCVSADDFRWRKANIKSISLLGSVLARQISADVGASETVMFRDGYLSEAAASNVWVVKNGVVMGPPKDHLVLEGIRYGLIEELCRELGLGFALQPLTRDQVLHADELLLSSATREVLAITQLDDRPVGLGRPGPVYAQLYAGYQAAKLRSRAAPPGSANASMTP